MRRWRARSLARKAAESSGSEAGLRGSEGVVEVGVEDGGMEER